MSGDITNDPTNIAPRDKVPRTTRIARLSSKVPHPCSFDTTSIWLSTQDEKSLRMESKPMRCNDLWDEKFDEKTEVEEIRLYPLRQMKLRVLELRIESLDSYCIENDSIKFKIPHGQDCIDWVKTQVCKIYCWLEENLGYTLNFEHDSRLLKCKGSYKYASTVCHFQAQVWKVEFGDWTSRDFIWEFRRRSTCGKDAFRHLLLIVPSFCKQIDAAMEFANNEPIYPEPMPISPWDGLNCWGPYTLDDIQNMEIVSDSEDEKRNITKDPDEEHDTDKIRVDLIAANYFSPEPSEETAITITPAMTITPHPEPQPELTSLEIDETERKMKCMITLGEGVLKRWRKQIEDPQNPRAGDEAIRTLRMCCYESEIKHNVEAVREKDALIRALCKKLEKSANPEVCLNILEICIEITNHSPYTDDLLVTNRILEIAAKMAYVHSGFSVDEPVLRSISVVQGALKLLEILTNRRDLHLPAELCDEALKILDKIPIDRQSVKDKSYELLKTVKNNLVNYMKSN